MNIDAAAGKKNLYRKNDYESTVKMSVCVSVNPVCATNQELNASELVSSLSVYENHYMSAAFAQPIRSRMHVS